MAMALYCSVIVRLVVTMSHAPLTIGNAAPKHGPPYACWKADSQSNAPARAICCAGSQDGRTRTACRPDAVGHGYGRRGRAGGAGCCRGRNSNSSSTISPNGEQQQHTSRSAA
jgi:hypothetical protein